MMTMAKHLANMAYFPEAVKLDGFSYTPTSIHLQKYMKITGKKKKYVEDWVQKAYETRTGLKKEGYSLLDRPLQYMEGYQRVLNKAMLSSPKSPMRNIGSGVSGVLGWNGFLNTIRGFESIFR